MVCATTPLGTEAGSERYYVENKDTEKTEVTNCQVNVEVTVPDGFFEPAYVVFQGEDGTLYRVTLLEENGYSSKIYVSPDHYTVLDAGIYENDTFSFDMDTVGFLLAKTIQAEEVRMGDIAAYRKGWKIIIHRVVEIEEEEGKKKFITKGDNNESADVPVEEEKIQYIILGIDAS